ncbi:MAG: hypothetical protein KKE91_04205 [Candidatus Omnitrophica bacterium]|nr:hypothetical protein [Candidatus Omnitrophota bacterium]
MALLSLRRKLVLFLIILASLIFVFSPLSAQEGLLPAQVKDISDRAYEPAIIELLDGAKESIVISMYNISLGTKERNPIVFLLNDLIEARQRNVAVTIYLNTRFREIDKGSYQLIRTAFFKKLLDTGCLIHLLPARLRLHDKLIIVDSRFVVEGSTNWSISALKSNRESATLIDSPELAKIKLLRLKMLPLTDEAKEKEPRHALYLEDLPDSITIPRAVLSESRYFPKMVTSHDVRSMDLYLLLLAHSQVVAKSGFFIELEGMALSLNMPVSWPDFSLRRQVIRSLKKLSKNYNLVRVKFFHGKDAWVELVNFPQETFTISSKLIRNDSTHKISQRLKFLLMVKSLLEAQGESFYSLSQGEIAKRFHIHRWTVGEAFKDLKQYEEKG